MLARLEPDSGVVVTGPARTVQELLQALRKPGVGSTRILTKAYWADGKAGLH